MNEKLEKIKKHVIDHKVAYSVGGVVAVAGITCLIMRSKHIGPVIHGTASPVIHGTGTRFSSDAISHGITETASHGITETGTGITNSFGDVKDSTLNIVSYISANRSGPPSWVVRCVETGQIYTSQNAASRELGISISHISKHLNGLLENAEGLHFERICMAA